MEAQTRTKRDKRQRAKRACEFCSRRKIKCPGEERSCSNCTAFGEDCVYKTGPKKPRPSNSRILHLEEENRRLREQLEQFESQSLPVEKQAFQAAMTGHDVTVIHNRPDPAESSDSDDEDSGQSAPYRPESSYNRSFEYHGPSSVLFEGDFGGKKPSDRQSGQGSSAQVYTLSMVETATQRQLESLDVASSKLDLDGIDPDMATKLLDLYWTRTNSFFMLVYRPAFNKSQSTEGPYFSRLLLNAMYFSASRYLQTRETHTGQALDDRFRQRFKTLLAAEYDRSSITTMQALLIVSVSLSAVGRHRRLAWLYSGVAFRMLIDLGLHTETPDVGNTPSNEAIEINRRVFWGAFSISHCSLCTAELTKALVIDKLQAFYHGRPVSIQRADTTVPLEFQDLESRESERWYPTESAPLDRGAFATMHSVLNFVQACRLALIMNKILNRIYREQSEVLGPEAIKQSVEQLNSELDKWHLELPQHLRISLGGVGSHSPRTPPQVYVVLLMSQVIRILLHRPFVSYGHLQSVLPEVARYSFSICAVAANNIAQCLESYNSVHSFALAPYFLFYASYVSATIHVRIAAQRHPDNNAAMHMQCLQTCLHVFDMNSQTNPAVKKAKAVIERLMERMDVNSANFSTAEEARAVNWRLLGLQTAPRILTPETLVQGFVSKGQDASTLQPPQGFDMTNIDFEAMLQSFSQREQVKNRVALTEDDFWSQAYATNPGAFTSSHGPGLEPYQNAGFPSAWHLSAGSHMEDTLFGFDASAGEEEG